jgi:hypothetical protein
MLIIALLLLAVNVFYGVCYLFKAAAWYGLGTPMRPRRFAAILSAILTGLAALESAGQLGMRDITILLPFAAIAYFYFSYNKQTHATSG